MFRVIADSAALVNPAPRLSTTSMATRNRVGYDSISTLTLGGLPVTDAARGRFDRYKHLNEFMALLRRQPGATVATLAALSKLNPQQTRAVLRAMKRAGLVNHSTIPANRALAYHLKDPRCTIWTSRPLPSSLSPSRRRSSSPRSASPSISPSFSETTTSKENCDVAD